ncbi:MAG: hypothetical protein NXH75_17360, partial [Halobacteriovoraceae bacterium]|nr:hypothetical protein [Halobacteriovoraceae bacterium]
MQKLAFTFITLVLFMVICEGFTRVATSSVILFDMEMHKYANSLKDYSKKELNTFTHYPNEKIKLMGVDVFTDNNGLRSSFNYPKGRAKKKVLVLGDSFTFGWGVPYEKTFVGLLSKKVKNHDFLNYGHCNYNTEQSLSHFQYLGKKEKPYAVYLFYFLNDAEKTPLKKEPQFYQRSQFLALLWSRFKAFKNNVRYDEYYQRLYSDDQEGWIQSQKSLIELKQELNLQKIKFIVFLLPDLRNFRPYPFKEQHREIMTFLEMKGIEAYDLINVFKD